MNNFSLKFLNTFSLFVTAKKIVKIYSLIELIKFCKKIYNKNNSIFILGEGSNVLFLENFQGLILLNRISGIYLKEKKKSWHLHVGAGVLWNNLVIYCIKKKIYGLENLTCIPGYVGAAPVNNIGAYGIEFNEICEYVDILNIISCQQKRLTTNECKFNYRDSIFKNDDFKNYIIISVGIYLFKYFKPKLNYVDLIHLYNKLVNPKQIYNLVSSIRKRKLPNLLLWGNAGSFFKNPIINESKMNIFFNKCSNIPYNKLSNNNYQLSAGWLIDKCKLREFKYKGASLYKKQSLILVNNGNATSNDIITLAKYIYNKVLYKFSIILELEVILVNKNGKLINN